MKEERSDYSLKQWKRNGKHSKGVFSSGFSREDEWNSHLEQKLNPQTYPKSAAFATCSGHRSFFLENTDGIISSVNGRFH